ncbi:MAG: MarR family transcriptional regulator [Acidimicrobiia bacterium]
MSKPATSRPELIRGVQFALRAMGTRLGRLNSTVAALVELKGGDIELLDHIGRVGPVSPGELAAHLQVHPATMTGILDRLQRGGWIVRERDSPDRRKVQLRAIRTRAPELVRLYAPMNASIMKICADFNSDQLVAIRNFLVSIGEAASEAAADIHK